MKIAIIDSGIDPAHERLKDARISGVTLALTPEGDVAYSDDFMDRLGHGTACAALIHKAVPQAHLVAVRIFHDDLTANEALICEGIRWCLAQSIDVINLSLGIKTATPHPDLIAACEQAYQHGIPLVSAAPNIRSVECYPACLPTVFGVTAGRVTGSSRFGHDPESSIGFAAKGTLQRLAWKDGGYTVSSGTSFACATFTGLLASERAQHPDLNLAALRRLMAQRADPDVHPLAEVEVDDPPALLPGSVSEERLGQTLFNAQARQAWMQNIALFPVGHRERDAFANFLPLCPFNIERFFAYPQRFQRADPAQNHPPLMQDWLPEAADLDAFDTLIVGDIHNHKGEPHLHYALDLLKAVVAQDKNLFVFDRQVMDLLVKHLDLRRYQGRIYVPRVDRQHYAACMRFRYLPRADVPILAVMGATTRQGTFTIQLRLKEILEAEGYDVAYLTTEPMGELFGADYCFPYGRPKNVTLEPSYWPRLWQTVLRGVAHHRRPHLILVGLRSGLVHQHDLPGAFTGLDSLYAMLGVRPDAVVYAINPRDPTNEVEHAAEVLRVLIDRQPVLYTLNHKFWTPDESQRAADHFYRKLGIRALDVMDPDNDATILDRIEQAFSPMVAA